MALLTVDFDVGDRVRLIFTMLLLSEIFIGRLNKILSNLVSKQLKKRIHHGVNVFQNEEGGDNEQS